jgi:NAD(P)H-nitrite reductase large subunit
MSVEALNSPDEVICPCSGTTRGKVISLFQQGLDAEAVSRRTGALSGCGGCEWDIAQIKEALDTVIQIEGQES